MTDIASNGHSPTVHIQLAIAGAVRKLRGSGSYCHDATLGEVLQVQLEDEPHGSPMLLLSASQLRKAVGGDFRHHPELHLRIDFDSGSMMHVE